MGSRFNYETNKPAVAVTTFVLLVSVILSVSARLGTKYGLFRKLTHDDLAIVASLLFAISQDIAIALAVDYGYGDVLKNILGLVCRKCNAINKR